MSDVIETFDPMTDSRVFEHVALDEVMELTVYFQRMGDDRCHHTVATPVFVEKNKLILRSTIEALLRGPEEDDLT